MVRKVKLMMVTKKDLIEIIEGIDADAFEFTIHTVDPGREWELPDVRMGAIYPPVARQIVRYREPSRAEITLAFQENQ